jgi:hypothetical protein
MLLNVPLLLRLPPGRPAIEVTTVVLATAYHYFNFHGLYCNSGLPDLIDSLLYALTHKTLVFTFSKNVFPIIKKLIFYEPKLHPPLPSGEGLGVRFFKNRPAAAGECQ